MYMSRRQTLALTVLATAAIALYLLFTQVGLEAKGPAHEQKIQGARRTLEAETALLNAKDPDSLAYDLVSDPIQAAMLGVVSSPITTDAGSLKAKVTATNPNFAAVIVDLLRQADVQAGDVVAVAYTGSFPVLDMATVIAVEAMQAEPIIVSSVGSSTWGANDPAFTILDIESFLMREGFIQNKSIAASVGGSFRTRPVSEEGRQMAEDAIKRNDVIYLHAENLDDSIRQRLQIYDDKASGRPIKAFVNVGGGLPSTGVGAQRREFTPGLSVGGARGDIEAEGLMFYMRERGVPVIDLRDIVSMARSNRLPVQPEETPPLGDGAPYHDWQRVRLTAAAAAILLGLALLTVRLGWLAPEQREAFDPYFGASQWRLGQRLSTLFRRRLTRPSSGEDSAGGAGALDD